MEITRETNHKKNTTIGSAMVDKFPWTINSIAEELGMPIPSFRVWKQKMEKEDKIARPAVNSLLCIADPDYRNRLLYSDEYMNKLRELRGNVRTHRKSSDVSESSLKHAKLQILVPIFDENVVKFLLKKYEDERGIQEYLKSHVIELVQPVMNEKGPVS